MELFKKILQDDRDDADDQSENSLKKYFVKYNLDTGIFTVGEHVRKLSFDKLSLHQSLRYYVNVKMYFFL